MNTKEVDGLKLFNKIKYVTEFIFMFCFSILLYKVITVKAYKGFWHGGFIFMAIVFEVLLLFNIIYNCKKDKDKIENMFLNFAIPIGILFIVFMIPTHTPDASSHIWKAYEVSNGIFFTKIDENGDSTTTVPKFLACYSFFTANWKYSDIENTLKSSMAFDYKITTEEVDSSAESYHFILYIGFAIGFAIARMIGLNIFLGIYLAKTINFIIVLAFGYLSIKLMPFGKRILVTYLMLPMMMQQLTAISADSITNIFIVLLITYTLHLAFKDERLTKKEIMIFMVFAGFLGIVKLVYAPMLGVGIILAKRRKDLSIKQKVLFGLVAVLICLATGMIWHNIGTNYKNNVSRGYLEREGVNSDKQLEFILSNPLKLGSIFVTTLSEKGDIYFSSMIGDYLGIMWIRVPTFLIVLYCFVLFFAIVSEENEKTLDKVEKIWIILLSIIMIIMILIGLYLVWTGVGEYCIEGVQGRYFLPILILVLLVFCPNEKYWDVKKTNVVITASAAIIDILFIIPVIQNFL
ncbi:MAG: DUF2142 domain-containing protein [Clostridia bacterium]|nr:DUF2142 domain-containing protein [Clostridia bacterium]